MRDSYPPLSELARPGKRARVAASLDGFHGPTSGRVELPHRMFWQAALPAAWGAQAARRTGRSRVSARNASARETG